MSAMIGTIRTRSGNGARARIAFLAIGLSLAGVAATVAAAPAPAPAAKQKTFGSPEKAAEALIKAAERYDIPALKQLLGPDGVDLVTTEDPVQDKNLFAAFAAEARRKTQVVRDATNPKSATLSIGADDWPMPIPIVEEEGKWRFDTQVGRQEILYRRIGRNELDAVEACRGYVEAQWEYAAEKRDGAMVNQYAQRIVSTPGKQDGLAWQDTDGTWQGPIGEEIARAITEGYSDRAKPYHGYFFKVLKGQGPSAPLGELDFVIKGAMIGGFAMVAAPAEHGVTGVMTFIVSHDGVVHQKDLGPGTLDALRAMERYDPDPSWTPVPEP